MAAVAPAGTDGWGFKLAASALVLATLSWPQAADAQSPKLEAAYVVLGPRGPVARAVLAQASAPMPSSTALARPSDAPYTEAAKPAGPAPTTATSKVLRGTTSVPKPATACQLRDRRIAQDIAAAHQHDRGITRAQSLPHKQFAAAGSASRSTQT